MKRLLQLLNLALLLSVVGCALTQGIDWSKVVGAIANAGLTMVLRNNPQSAAYIGLTQTILDSFIARKTTDLSLLERDLQQVPAEWREVIKIALDEAGTKIGTKLTEDEKLALLHQYLEAIRNGVANVSKPASGVHTREYKEAQRILKERGFNLSQYPASRGISQLSAISSQPPPYGWRTLWIPGVTTLEACPVSPQNMLDDHLMGYGYVRRMEFTGPY